ncbi:hypothetical protein LZ30DRAFT_699277 [Colletotrichum cereale]|nr:hypothetical protein LZ30DRAFT_699277 [Colletotrichum cereale]
MSLQNNRRATFTSPALFGRAMDKRGLGRGREEREPWTLQDRRKATMFLRGLSSISTCAMVISDFTPLSLPPSIWSAALLGSLVNEAYLPCLGKRTDCDGLERVLLFSSRFYRSVSVPTLHKIGSDACISAHLTKDVSRPHLGWDAPLVPVRPRLSPVTDPPRTNA